MMMVKDLRPSKSSAINGNRAHSGNRAGEYGMFGEISRPLVLSVLIHVAALGGLFVVAPYISAPTLLLPPAQMVQLVDLPAGGGGGGADTRNTPSRPRKNPLHHLSPPRRSARPSHIRQNPNLRRSRKLHPRNPKTHHASRRWPCPRRSPRNRPRKSPQSGKRRSLSPHHEQLPRNPRRRKKRSLLRLQTPPTPAPRREATARVQPERSGPGSGGQAWARVWTGQRSGVGGWRWHVVA